MIRRCQPLLGTFVEIRLDGANEASLQSTADKAFRLVRTVHRMMSAHDRDSDVSRLNRCGHLSALRVHPWTWHVIDEAVRLSRESEGAFDITAAPHLVNWGYLPDPGQCAVPPASGLWRQIEMLPDLRIRFHRPLWIDLGGIAKGFAVDKAMDFIESRSVPRATVNAGGDLRVRGDPAPTLSLRDPRDPSRLIEDVPMPTPAAATSATYFSRKQIRSRVVSPLVHAASGRPLTRRSSVTVFAPTCLQADALTKVVLLAPREVGARVLASRRSQALIVSPSGRYLHLPE